LVDLIATTLAWAILHLTLLEFDFVFPVIWPQTNILGT
jgi:hypothetical protein